MLPNRVRVIIVLEILFVHGVGYANDSGLSLLAITSKYFSHYTESH